MFQSLLSGLNMSKNKTEQNFYPISTACKARTTKRSIINGSFDSEKSDPYRVKRPTF